MPLDVMFIAEEDEVDVVLKALDEAIYSISEKFPDCHLHLHPGHFNVSNGCGLKGTEDGPGDITLITGGTDNEEMSVERLH